MPLFVLCMLRRKAKGISWWRVYPAANIKKNKRTFKRLKTLKDIEKAGFQQFQESVLLVKILKDIET